MIALHTLLGTKDIIKYLIGIESFLRFLPVVPVLVIYSDGSLTNKDRSLIESRLGDVRWITEKNLDWSIIPLTHQALLKAKRVELVLNRKLIDLVCNGVVTLHQYSKHVLLDSDVFFYASPRQLVAFLLDKTKANSSQALYMQDYQNAYVAPKNVLDSFLPSSLIPQLNSGLIAFTPSVLSPQKVCEYYASIEENSSLLEPHAYYPNTLWEEQTGWAYLLGKQGVQAQALPKTYYVGKGDAPHNLVCRHYVHGTRHLYLRESLR